MTNPTAKGMEHMRQVRENTPGSGHPRHQLRDFTVTVRRTGQRAGRLHVRAQTERDAILRAGLALARRYPGTDAELWTVTGVHDPAPFAWSPDEDQP